MKLLLVEDDVELARQLRRELEESGYQVSLKRDGKEGLDAALSASWDLAVLDVSLPVRSGFEIVEAMRRSRIDTPVIFLTALGEVKDRVEGLARGGDDYLVKPFSMDELKARLLALARRYSLQNPVAIELPEDWKLDRPLREVIIRGRAVPLQPREWSLLNLFLNNEGKVLTGSFLLDRVWDIHFDPGTNVVNSTVCRLRKKIDEPGRVSHIETIRGRGYVFHNHA